MRTGFTRVALGATFILLFAASGFAGAVEFKFYTPPMPSAPEIVSVTNKQPVSGCSEFMVAADIQGQAQKEVCCNGVCTHQCEPNCDFSACGMTDFTGAADPRITPNPACIPCSADSSGGAAPSICGGKSGNPKLYYYYNADLSTTASANMTYDAAIGRFKASIPIDLYESGDVVTYYIVAADSRGNVVSEVPESLYAPCSAPTSWDEGYDTPPLANCSAANSYEQCGYFKSGTPTCGSEYTINDRAGDTCGENRTLSPDNKLDILGMTAGYGKGFSDLPSDNVVCAKVKLAGNPPDIGDNSTPISSYILNIYNPDIVDPNPNDAYIPNVTPITYTPGVNGTDCNLVKVLWNGECVTNPNTSDPLSCKLIAGGSSEARLKISSTNGFLTFIAKDLIPGGKTLVGGNSKSSSIVMTTGNIQLDGGTPFWIADSTTGLSMIAKNHNVSIAVGSYGTCDGSPLPPFVPSLQTCINGVGTASPGTCGQSVSRPDGNICRLTINPSLDLADKYTIYRNSTNNASSAIKIADITTNLSGQNIYNDTITTLDGKKYYYFFSGTRNGIETPQKDWSTSSCTIEDWVPSVPATGLYCKTPFGKSRACECKWNQDTISDPSVKGFRVYRGATQIADENTILAASGMTEYSTTDRSVLSVGVQYTYTIKTVDAGGNVNSGVLAVCVPEDLEAPAKIDSLNVSLVQGARVGVKAVWNGGPERDIDKYNIYKCDNKNLMCDSFPSANWIKINDNPVAHTGTDIHSFTVPDVRDGGTAENDWCFWVEACDNCDSTGSCPSTGAPNCSPFVTIRPYMQCMDIRVHVDLNPPAAPAAVQAQSPPPPEGRVCRITWSKVTTNADGTPFADPNNPQPNELSAYYVMTAPPGETVPNNPNTAAIHNIAGIVNPSSSPFFEDEWLSNGMSYQYLVIAYDAAQNYSAPQSSPVICMPEDIVKPLPVSVVTATKGAGDVSCDFSWEAVADRDELTYSVHRCDKRAANCTKATSVDFPTAWGAELGQPITGITAPLELSDTTVDLTANEYTYCITARDPSGNEPPIFTGANAALASNCVQCSVMTPPPTYDPPISVTVSPYSGSPNMGAKIKYTNSPSYIANGNTGSHSIYLCSSSNVVSCSKVLATGLTADFSSVSKDFPDLIASHAVAPGTYYFAVSYTNDLGSESVKTMSAQSVEINLSDPCDVAVPPAACNMTIKVGKITEKKIVACTLAADPTGCKSDAYKFVEAAPAGAVVNIIDTTTGQTVKSVYPDVLTGAVPEIKVDPVNTTWYNSAHKYKVVLEIPAESYGGLYGVCANSSTVVQDGKCSVLLHEPALISSASPLTTAPKTIIKVRAVAGDSPDSFVVGNGGDIGDVNGDGKVDIKDLLKVKVAYSKSSASQCYKPWADINLDGSVTIKDLLEIKKMYGKTIARAAADSTLTPALLESTDPIPACCKTSPPSCQ